MQRATAQKTSSTTGRASARQQVKSGVPSGPSSIKKSNVNNKIKLNVLRHLQPSLTHATTSPSKGFTKEDGEVQPEKPFQGSFKAINLRYNYGAA
jgi:hypothetical protein